MNSVASYMEANAVCCIILLIILFNEQCVSDRADYRVLFCQFLIFTILYMLADSVWLLTEQDIIPNTTLSFGIVNFIYMLTMEVAAYRWLLYCFSYTKSPHLRSRRSRRMTAVPFVFASAIVLTELLFGNNVYMDSEGGVHYPLVYFVAVLPYLLYLITASVQCLRAAGQNRYGTGRFPFITMALYPAFMLLTYVLQLLNLGLPTLVYGSTVACLFTYLVCLQSLITLDTLTQMNNRNQLNLFMKALENENAKEPRLCMMMIDADQFKRINDSYGHASGDDALKAIAAGLKTACGSMNELRPFLARYGGDEFFAAFRTLDEQRIREAADAIRASIAKKAGQMELPFEIGVSFGWAFLLPGESGMDCLMRADKALYHQKSKLTR